LKHRQISYKSRTFTVTVYPDGTVALTDENNKVIAGWPTTIAIDAGAFDSTKDEDLSRLIGRITGAY
jgi:hypothetical protein